MSVHNSKPWELDASDYSNYKDVIEDDAPVQFVFAGCGLPAHKNFLSWSKAGITDNSPPKLNFIHNPRKRSKAAKARHSPHSEIY